MADIDDPAVFVAAGGVVNFSLLPEPAISESVPKLVEPAVMPVIVAPPVAFVILFVEIGDPTVGRTWIPDQVIAAVFPVASES